MNLKSYLQEVYKFRHLCLHIVGSDLRARFRRSKLGILWAMLQPLVLTCMFSLVLIQITKEPFETYSVYVFSGLVMWDFITTSCMLGAVAYLGAASYLLQNKIPLLVFSLRVVIQSGTIFALSAAGLLIYTSAVTPQFISWTWLWLPAYALLLGLFCAPLAVICGVLNTHLRDFKEALGLILQALWFMSPVFMARDIFKSSALAAWTSINPIAALCDILRDILMRASSPKMEQVAVVLVAAFLLSLFAGWLLARTEKRLVFFVT